MVLLLLVVVVYAWQIEPRMIGVTRIKLPERLAGALGDNRVVFLADLHVTPGWAKEKRLLATLDSLQPDYLLIGGDLVWYQGDIESSVDLLKKLRGRKGTYAVLGDADYMGRIRNCAFCHQPGSRELRHDIPMRVLRNEAVDLADGSVRLVGLDGDERGQWPQTCRQWLDDSTPAIVMSHFPEAFPLLASAGADLVLSGDTHGGQIRAPRWLIKQLFGQPRAQYLYGWFRSGDAAMFVTRGVGESLVPLRFACPPEIVLLEGAK